MAVVIETTLGDITIDLYINERPKACLNFLKLCRIKYYNFNLFHTINQGFIAQTGDPTGMRTGGESIWGVMEGPLKRYFEAENSPRIKHTSTGLVSFVGDKDSMIGSQFFITLAPDLTYLDSQHCVFGEVSEGFEVLRMLNESICDGEHRPYQDIRITHTVVLEDPFPDPDNLRVPDASPEPSAERLQGGRIAPDEEIDETEGRTIQEVQEIVAEKEAKARATILEMIGDIPDAEMAPPENVLFVCKLNPVTTDDDLEIIFSRFGKIKSCEVIRDKKTGDSLQYAFVEFEEQKSCESAYFKMDNVLIDDRRIHVDFSQSVAKIKWHGKGRGVTHFNDRGDKESGDPKNDIGNGRYRKERDDKFENGKSRERRDDRDSRRDERNSRQEERSSKQDERHSRSVERNSRQEERNSGRDGRNSGRDERNSGRDERSSRQNERHSRSVERNSKQEEKNSGRDERNSRQDERHSRSVERYSRRDERNFGRDDKQNERSRRERSRSREYNRYKQEDKEYRRYEQTTSRYNKNDYKRQNRSISRDYQRNRPREADYRRKNMQNRFYQNKTRQQNYRQQNYRQQNFRRPNSRNRYNNNRSRQQNTSYERYYEDSGSRYREISPEPYYGRSDRNKSPDEEENKRKLSRNRVESISEEDKKKKYVSDDSSSEPAKKSKKSKKKKPKKKYRSDSSEDDSDEEESKKVKKRKKSKKRKSSRSDSDDDSDVSKKKKRH